jgi:tetraacyldisaccharide 4'-kinase
MKTPIFWYRRNSSFLSTILSPIASIYGLVSTYHREHSTPQSVPVPVICLGNFVAGGSGKTPTAIALMTLLKEAHFFLSPAFVTRGYKGKIEGPERVDESHDAILWGDEALILARHAPTYVSSNRYEGADTAVFQGADAVILDDGLQNYHLHKNISFAIIDGLMGFGNEHIIPAGPLRQSLEEGFSLVDAVIFIGEDAHNTLSKIPDNIPVFKAKTIVKPNTDLPNVPYVAFCGIGYPDKFKATLAAEKVNVLEFKSFGDHHYFTMADIQELVEKAMELKARLITTEKDFVRLPDFNKKGMIDSLPIEIVFESNESILEFIRHKVSPSSDL